MRCFECGYLNPAGARFCDHCGKRMTKQLLILDDRSPSETKSDAGDGFHPARFLSADSAKLSIAGASAAAERDDFCKKTATPAARPVFYTARFNGPDQAEPNRLKRTDFMRDDTPGAKYRMERLSATRAAPSGTAAAGKNQDAGAHASIFHNASFNHPDRPQQEARNARRESCADDFGDDALEKSAWKVPRAFDQPGTRHTLHDAPKTEVMIAPPPKADLRFTANWRSVFFAPVMVLLLILALISMILIAHVTEWTLYLVLIAVMVFFGFSGAVADYQLQAGKWNAEKRAKKHQYLKYLKKLENEWNIRAEQQLQDQGMQDPSIEGCIALLESKSESIWKRDSKEEDYLCVRIGTGKRPFEIGILTPPTPYEERKEELHIQMRNLVEAHRYISPAPVLCDLKQQPLIGIIGKPSETTRVIQGVLMQIATFHSPEQVEIILQGAEHNMRDWGMLCRLPHIRREREILPKSSATEESIVQRLLQERRQSARLKTDTLEKRRNNRFLVLVVLQEAALKRRDLEALSLLANRDCETCVIMQSVSESSLPPQTNLIMRVADGCGELHDRSEAEPDQQISLDLASAEQVSRFVGAASRR